MKTERITEDFITKPNWKLKIIDWDEHNQYYHDYNNTAPKYINHSMMIAYDKNDSSLLCCHVDDNGSPDFELDGDLLPTFNWVELTNPETQECVDAINKAFNTTFQLNQFAGR